VWRETENSQLSTLLNLSARIILPTSPEFVAAQSHVSIDKPVVAEIGSDNIVHGYAILSDAEGVPSAVVLVSTDRVFYDQASALLSVLMLSLVGSGIALALIIMLLLDRLVLRRLEGLTFSVQKVSTDGDLSSRVAISGNDELSLLGTALNNMISAIQQDVAARRRIQDDLQEALTRFEAVIDNAPMVAIQGFDRHGKILHWNAAASRLYGYSASEAIGKRLQDLILVQEQHEVFESELEKLWTTGKAEEPMQWQVTARDGRPRWVYSSMFPVLENGKVVETFCMDVDVTMRKAIEEDLQELRRIVSLGPVVVVLWRNTPGHPVEFVSDSVSQFGYPPEELLSNRISYLSLVHPDDVDRLIAESADHIAKGEDAYLQEYRIRTKDGRVRFVEDRTWARRDVKGNVTHLQGLIIDVTARKEAEAALRAGEQREKARVSELQTILDTVPAGIWITHDSEGRTMSGNREASRLLRVPTESNPSKTAPEDIRPTNYRVFVDGAEIGGDKLPMQTAAREGLEIRNAPLEIRFEDGSATHLLGNAAPIVGPDGVSHGAVGAFVDVTESRQAEGVIREYERRFKDILESVQLVAVMLDTDARITYCNEYLCQLTGWSREELIGRNWLKSMIQVSDREMIAAVQQDLVKDGLAATHFDNHILTRDGETRLISWDNTLLRDPSGKIVGTASLGRDITQLRDLEEQYRHSQKMESIGRLAGGVAHDFNNLLTPIVGYAEMMLSQIPREHPMHARVAVIQEAAARAQVITRQLLAFSRKQSLEMLPIDLNKVATGFAKILSHTLREDIRINTKLAQNLATVKADPSQMEQVLMNLAVNAQDAMPEGGELTIETGNVTLDEAYAAQHSGIIPGEFVLLQVSDTGTGMDAVTLKNIFEPFFTTKEKGKGTGLGLSMVYGIVKQHGGQIWAYSEQGHGSTFKMYLPVLSGEKPVDVPRAKPSATEGKETILVVEDNKMVLSLVLDILKSKGYRVLEACDPREAMETSASFHEEINLLFTDVIMPEMNGRELFDRLSKDRPAMKVLYMSGYADEVITHQGIIERGTAFIQKPFTLSTVLAKVRAVLDS
ncbi:MAG: PAS domain S-box protein, partial [Candidatus Brocadiia bacterium]